MELFVLEKKKIILGIDASIKSSGLAILDGETGEVIAYDRLPIKTKDFNSDENKKGLKLKDKIEKMVSYTGTKVYSNFISLNTQFDSNKIVRNMFFNIF